VIAVLALFAATGLGLVAFGSRLRRNAFLVASGPMVAAALWAGSNWGEVTGGGVVTERFAWVGMLGLSGELRLDGLALLMTLIVSAVGVAVLWYAASYFATDAPDVARLAGLLTLFGGAMIGLVQADNLLLLYACWELTSITSFLLIGNRHTEARARAAALHALLVTGAGGLALLGGLVLIGVAAGTFRLSAIVAHPPPTTAVVTAGVVLLLVGAATKSAQYPFHAWLPGAMAAPTPVSAYLHSATMVKAGVVLLARFAPAFAGVPSWRPVILVLGSATMVFGGLRALRQHDLKLLLAFGTVSQLGLLTLLFGTGTAAAATAGTVLLVAHAAFKATLFMVVGTIDHQTGTRDIRALPPLARGWRPLEVVTIVAAASMAGVPLAAGFISKELAFGALTSAPFGWSSAVAAAAVGGSALTAAYSLRFYWGAFPGSRRTTAAAAPAPAWAIVAPAAVLAAVGIVMGVFPQVLDGAVAASVRAYGAPAVHLALWHGLGLPVLLSAVALAGGAALFAGDRWAQPVLARGSAVPSGSEVYLALLRRLGAGATRVTAFVQNGSLPVYAGVILATTAAACTAAIVGGVRWPGLPPALDVVEVPVVGVLVAAAAGASVVRRRFAAALFLGVAGYAMAGLFVLLGAPDLALTQTAVETLSTVVFVLVLRRLPERFERQSTPRRRLVRLAVSGGVAAAVFLLAIVAAGYRLGGPVSDEMVAAAVPDGHGRNVVNVILVDFRGFDTLAEITVLAVASIGAVALARVGRRAAQERGEVATRPGIAPSRLPFVDVSVRVVFHALVLTSLWLLFAGHNQPGGGFVGGLLAGSAITLRYVAGGIAEVRSRTRFRPWTVLGAGLLCAAATAAAPLLFGRAPLRVGLATVTVPVIGAVKVSSALVFDAGVYLAVVGMVLMVFEAFGDEPVEAAA
jgi:multicomponent Na+:H+ antiporter subunit A